MATDGHCPCHVAKAPFEVWPQTLPGASTGLSKHAVGVELLFAGFLWDRCLSSGHIGTAAVFSAAPPRSPPPLAIPPPPGGEPSLGPKSTENTRRQRRQRKCLQGATGAEADLHCDTMVQFCGAPPPPPQRGGTGLTKGDIARGGGFPLCSAIPA